MQHPRLKKALAATAVSLALTAAVSSTRAAIISLGNVQHTPPTTLSVGVGSPGSLTVDGGTVLDQTNATFGASNFVNLGVVAGSTGTGLVTGAGSTWIVGTAPNTPTGSFNVGVGGTATLTANQGGSLIGTQLGVGGGATGNGTVNIDGTGSAGQFTQFTTVGVNGTGNLNISNGGRFVSTFVAVNQSVFTAGASGTGTGSISVTGAGSQLATRGIITLGLGTTGTPSGALSITNGGLVDAVALQTAFNPGTSANVLVSGAGSLLHLSSFNNQPTSMSVGRVGSGQLDVTAGGKILMDPSAANATLTSFNAFNIGGPGGGAPPAGAVNSVGIANVTGAGSEIRLSGNFSTVGVGRVGTGTLNIIDGAQVIVENLTGGTFSAIGRATGANGTVLISGTGSLLQAGNKLFIGTELTATTTGGTEAPGGGTGVLTISNGGKVVAGSDVIIGAGGTVKGNGGTIQGNVINKGNIAPGNSPGIMTIVGNLTLTATGNLNIELAGTNNTNPALPQFDQIIVLDNANTAVQEGNIVVDGNVNVAFLPGFDAHAGDFFDILGGFDITQLNPNFLLPTLGAGLDWDIREIATRGGEVLRLSVVERANVPEPGMFALLGIGLAGLGALRRRRS